MPALAAKSVKKSVRAALSQLSIILHKSITVSAQDVFLALMFVFSLDNNSLEYLKRLDIPYAEIKKWLEEKRG